MTYLNSTIFEYGQPGVDAGGRNRVSQLTTLLDGKLTGETRNLIFNRTGSGVFSDETGSLNMSVDAGEYCIWETKRPFTYLSGKSQFIEMTFDSFASEANVNKKCGYFSDQDHVVPFSSSLDGFWLENDGNTIRLCAENKGTETLNVAITDWYGYDNLAEYKNISTWDNFTVVFIDFLWLGGAVLRLWVKTSTGFVLGHIFHYSGTRKGTFIQFPSQKLRYEIRSNGGSGNFRYICSQIATEGSIAEAGIASSIDRGFTATSAPTAGTKYVLCGIRKRPNKGNASVLLDDITSVSTTNDFGLLTLEINPTLSSPLVWNDVPNFSIQQTSGSQTVVSNGNIIKSIYIEKDATLSSNVLSLNFQSYLGSSIDGTPDEYVLTVTPLSGDTNMEAHGGISFKEF